jgi:hypothetical protein
MQIQIDQAGLSEIYAANMSVTLARTIAQSVDAAASQAAASQTIVGWQAFAPLQQNTVTWTDQFYCFAATTPLVAGQVITMNAQSDLPMQAGLVYEFAQGHFTAQKTTQNVNSYIIANNTLGGRYVFGMAQTAVVNGVAALNPFCATPVLYNQAAYFTPTNVIAVFLSSATRGGAILPPPFNALEVAASGGASEPVVGFNDQTNTFFVISEEGSS